MDQEPGGAAQSSEVSGPLHAQKNFQINWNHGSEGFRGAAGFSCGGAWHAAGFGDLKPNVWYHLAATYDGENLKAYRDGVLVQDNAAPSGDSDQEKLTLKLGRHGLAEWFFAGAVDEVCVFACALEADEVKALYDGKEPTTIVARPEASADAGRRSRAECTGSARACGADGGRDHAARRQEWDCGGGHHRYGWRDRGCFLLYEAQEFVRETRWPRCPLGSHI